MNTILSSKEISLPIIIKTVTLESDLGTIIKDNARYHNVIVPNCPKYIQNELRTDNYTREKPILRIRDETVQWPDHPLSPQGKILGAIIIIVSGDEKILLVRNGKLWGLPKGARNFLNFMELKKLTEEYYMKTNTIMEHESVELKDMESSVDNICRETLEETGIEINKEYLLSLDNESNPYNRYYYEFPHNSDTHKCILELNGTDHENDELLWITYDQLKKMLKTHRDPYQNKVFNHVTYNCLSEYIFG